MLSILCKFEKYLFLLDINGVYWYCETDTDCNSYVSDAFCSLENCICPAGKVLSSDLTRCIDGKVVHIDAKDILFIA